MMLLVQPTRARDVGWLVVAVAAGLFATFSAGGGIVALLRGRWLLAATSPLYALAGYWFCAGGYRRTRWGKDLLGDPPPDPPALSPTRARQLIVVAVLCALAAGVALAAQIVAAR
jgi:hypothetical protein